MVYANILIMLLYPIFETNIYYLAMNNANENDTNVTINSQILEPIFQSKYDILHFDTETDGCFEIINNKIYKIKEHTDYEEYQFNKEILFQLQHTPNSKKETFYIPIHHTYNKIEVKKYKLHPSSLLTLIVENNKTMYFETKENEITESIKEDLISFLSLLKLYK